MNNLLVENVRSSFMNKFHTKPFLVFSPRNIYLIGKHTDYNTGFVLSTATDKGILLAFFVAI